MLLIISGIDLLLAALCAAVGLLVLLIGSTSASGAEAAEDSQRLSDWIWVDVRTGKFQNHRLLCDGREINRSEFNGTIGYRVLQRNQPPWRCQLELSECVGTGRTVITVATRQHVELFNEDLDCTHVPILMQMDENGVSEAGTGVSVR